MAEAEEVSTDASFMLAGARISEEDFGGLLMAVLVDNADGIVILDADGEIIAANPAAEELFGRPVDSLIGTPLGTPLASGVRTELEILTPRGLRYAELLSRTTSWQGDFAVVATLRDVTDRRRAIDALRDYVSMTAHEVATPLTSISGFAETLTNAWDEIGEDRRRQFVAIIHRQAVRVASISQDLLALSRLDAASMERHASPLTVATMVRELFEEGAADLDDWDVAIDPSLRVMADPHQVQTILRNFLSNATKYGEGPFTVRATAVEAATGPAVEIAIGDAGEGVPLDFIPHLFERFARAKRGVARSREGTGLGLSLSHGLAKLNGGMAGYRPNEPRGSIFTLTLPRP